MRRHLPAITERGRGKWQKSDSELFSQNWAKDSLLSKLRRSQSNCCSCQSANIIKGLCQEYIFPEGPTCPISTLNLYVSDCYYVSNMAKTLLWSKPQHRHSHIHRVYHTSTASYSTKDKLTTTLLPSTGNSNYKTLPTNDLIRSGMLKCNKIVFFLIYRFVCF